jgi:hypothetical protein
VPREGRCRVSFGRRCAVTEVVEKAVEKIVATLLDLVSAEFLHGKIDEQAQIRAARAAADEAAAAKFGEQP